MGFFLFYLTLFFCVLFPAFLIFKSSFATISQKTKWLFFCFFSAFAPGITLALIIVLLERFEIRVQTAQTLMFGPETILLFLASLNTLIMPWIILKIFKKKYSKQ